MSEWFGWLQQKALADPFAKRYGQAAKGVLVGLAALVFMVFAAFLITYPSIAERPSKSTDPTWADSVILAQIVIGLIVLGAGSVLAVLFYSIRTSSPQPDWRSFLVPGRCGESREWRCYPVRRHSSGWGSPAPC